MRLRMCMELDTEFRYPNVIDFWGLRFIILPIYLLLGLNKYAAYNNYAENNIEESNKRLCEEIEQRIKESDKKYHEDIIDDYHQRDAGVWRHLSPYASKGNGYHFI